MLHHFPQSVGSDPVARMLSYPYLTSTLSEITSSPSITKSFPSDSCLYRVMIGHGGDYCDYIRFSFAVKSAVSKIPYVFNRCVSRLLAFTVAYLVCGSLRCEIYVVYAINDLVLQQSMSSALSGIDLLLMHELADSHLGLRRGPVVA